MTYDPALPARALLDALESITADERIPPPHDATVRRQVVEAALLMAYQAALMDAAAVLRALIPGAPRPEADND